MGSIIVLLLFFIFSVVFLFTCLYHVHSRNARTRTSTARADHQLPVTEGIDPEAISAFPIVKYCDVKGIKVDKGVPECAVCLSEFGDEDLVRLLPECDHVFHPLCIDAWLASHATCPVCRKNLIQAPDLMTTYGELSDDVVIRIHDDDRRSTANLVSPEAFRSCRISV
ncbi:hypothetical protein QQ045_006151 [Rhodiola kirilowii]